MISATIEARSPAELRALSACLEAMAVLRERVIAAVDNPEVGALPPAPIAAPVPATPDPAAVFGQPQGVAVVPVPPPPTPVAPSGAAAAVPSTAPAVPPASSPTPPPAVVSHVPPLAPPAAAAPAAPTSPAGVELDAEGLPWDGRIHGSTKTKNADGTWRQRRGLNDPALKRRVEDELRAALAVPAPVVAAVPLPPAAPVTLEQAVAAMGAGVPVPPAAATVAPPATLAEFMQRVAPIISADATRMALVHGAVAQAGLPSLALLGSRPDLVPTVWQHLQTALA